MKCSVLTMFHQNEDSGLQHFEAFPARCPGSRIVKVCRAVARKRPPGGHKTPALMNFLAESRREYRGYCSLHQNDDLKEEMRECWFHHFSTRIAINVCGYTYE